MALGLGARTCARVCVWSQAPLPPLGTCQNLERKCVPGDAWSFLDYEDAIKMKRTCKRGFLFGPIL